MRNLLSQPHLTTLGQFLLLFSLLLPVTAFAQFTQLVNIPGLQGDSINDYVRALFYIAIGIAAMLAVVKLVIAGAKYMLSDVANTKQTAISDIRGAIFGLLLILATVLILNTISQNIVETDIGGGLPEFRTATQQLDLSDRFDRIGDMCTPETGGENPDGVRCEMERCSATTDLTGGTIGFIRSCQERCDARENSVFVPDPFLGGECYWPDTSVGAAIAECEDGGGTAITLLDGSVRCGNIQNIVDDLTVDPNNPGDFNEIVTSEYNVLVPGWDIDANNQDELEELQTECESIHGGSTLIVAEVMDDSDTLFVLCAE